MRSKNQTEPDLKTLHVSVPLSVGSSGFLPLFFETNFLSTLYSLTLSSFPKTSPTLKLLQWQFFHTNTYTMPTLLIQTTCLLFQPLISSPPKHHLQCSLLELPTKMAADTTSDTQTTSYTNSKQHYMPTHSSECFHCCPCLNNPECWCATLQMEPPDKEDSNLLKNAQMALCVNFSIQTTTRTTETTI